MLNNFSSKCIKMAKRCAFETSYGITNFNSGIKVRPSLGKACTNICHVFGFVISTPGQGQQLGFTYLQSMDFQREPQSKHHLYCEQEKPAHCHGSLLLKLGTHQIQSRTRDAHKISPHGTMAKRTPAMNWDHAVSWGGGLG